MRRTPLIIVAVFMFSIPARREIKSLPSDQRQQTIEYVLSLQKPNGGFVGGQKPDSPASPATSSALRALKYFGGKNPRPGDTKTFVLSCLDRKSGGFAPTPGGVSDVRTTCVGLMAAAELKMLHRELDGPAILSALKYLRENVKSFEDMRITAAAQESADLVVGHEREWIRQIEGMRNEDGTYGSKDNRARDTAGSLVTLMRLHAFTTARARQTPYSIINRDEVIKAIKDGQLPDGGFGKEGQMGSDLETTYRVMRAFHMLKTKPADAKVCREFIAKCRNADGSYSLQPGQPGNVSATYFAGIILYWLE